jgi:hypothetical protein
MRSSQIQTSSSRPATACSELLAVGGGDHTAIFLKPPPTSTSTSTSISICSEVCRKWRLRYENYAPPHLFRPFPTAVNIFSIGDLSINSTQAWEPWALVTGASGRGGAAIARALHRRGMSIVIHHTARSAENAVALMAELVSNRPNSAQLWLADFTATEFERSGVPRWLVELGVTVVVCNASAYHPSDVGDTDRARIDHAIHVTGHAAILNALRPRGDSPPRARLRSVVAITDIAVVRPPRGHLSYTTGSRPIPWCRSTARRRLSCTVLSEPLRTAEWAQCRSRSASLQAACSAG